MVSIICQRIGKSQIFICLTTSHQAAEQLGEYDFGFDLEKVGIEVYEKGEELKIEIFRNASYTKKLELIKLTFTITGWEIDIADGYLDFTFDVKEIPRTWIYAECECPGYYK